MSLQPKKKKKPKPQPEALAEPAPAEATPPEEVKGEINGFHANGSVVDGESLDSLSEQLDSASLDAVELDSEPATSETTGNHGLSLGWLVVCHLTNLLCMLTVLYFECIHCYFTFVPLGECRLRLSWFLTSSLSSIEGL